MKNIGEKIINFEILLFIIVTIIVAVISFAENPTFSMTLIMISLFFIFYLVIEIFKEKIVNKIKISENEELVKLRMDKYFNLALFFFAVGISSWFFSLPEIKPVGAIIAIISFFSGSMLLYFYYLPRYYQLEKFYRGKK
ncbi:MAG: hypothetical protein KKD18_03460 [Nanoarchaeota archaeon]|nr:hypothetical protein [Nanoarchaeota archaeon]